jgi:hypothetical protein
LPVFKTNYTEADRLTFANISEEYAAYLGYDLALDYVDPEFVDPPVNNTELPEFSNSTDPHNFTSVPDEDFVHIFGENLYPHNLATQIKFFRTLVLDSGTLPNSTSDEPLSRSKRQLLVAAAAFSGVLGTFFGLYNLFKIHKIQSDILNLSDQHNLLVNVVKKHEQQIHELAAELNHLTDVVILTPR